MARSASSKRSDARKKPPTSKLPRGTPKATKTKSTRRKATAVSRKQTKVKGKPKTASTRSAKGVAKAPKRSPKISTKRAGKAEATQQVQAATGGERAATETPGAHSPRIEVRNVNVPGYHNTVDATKYASMRSSLFSVLPNAPPGLTQSEMLEAVVPKLSQEHFPRGDKAMWWIKTVQLDQEARGAMKRSDSKPLRWWRT